MKLVKENIKQLMIEHNLKADIKLYLNNLRQDALDVLIKINAQNQSKKYLEQLLEFAISRTY